MSGLLTRPHESVEQARDLLQQIVYVYNRLQNIGIKTPTRKTPDSLAKNLLKILQSRALSRKLTSCSIHAAKLVQTYAETCKVPPGFLATSRGYLVKSVQQLDKNGVFRPKSLATCYFFLQSSSFRICTFFHQFARLRPVLVVEVFAYPFGQSFGNAFDGGKLLYRSGAHSFQTAEMAQEEFHPRGSDAGNFQQRGA